LGKEDQLLSPAQSPLGRWHTKGQRALYLSGSPEGCRIALKVYRQPNEPKRGIFPITVTNARVADLRLNETREAFEASLEDIHAFWADMAKAGQTSPTWELSDKARSAGLDGLLSPSRSRPALTHLTLFKWNDVKGAQIKRSGPPVPF